MLKNKFYLSKMYNENNKLILYLLLLYKTLNFNMALIFIQNNLTITTKKLQDHVRLTPKLIKIEKQNIK